MKRLFALFMVTVLFVTSMVVSAYAASESKISEELQYQMINAVMDEKIETRIWLRYTVNEEEMDSMVYEECGLTRGLCDTLEKVNQYKTAHYQITSRIMTELCESFIEKAAIREEDLIFKGEISPYLIAMLTKDEIMNISANKEVERLDYFAAEVENPGSTVYPDPSDPPIDDPDYVYGDLIENAKRYYHVDCPTESIHVLADEYVRSGWYLVKIGIDGYEYDDTVRDIKIGTYVLHIEEPEPLLFPGYTLITLKEGYDRGIISYADLEYFAKNYGLDLKKLDIIGDSDRDGELTILDATGIQRFVAELINDDGLDLETADADKDGEVTILDATRIQRCLADLCKIDGTTPDTLLYSE